MSFHAYSKPLDYIYCSHTARYGIYEDATLTSGNIRINLGYDNGPISDTFSRADTVSGLNNSAPEVGTICSADPTHPYLWSTGHTWGISSGKAYSNKSSGASVVQMASPNSGGRGVRLRTDMDVSVEVSCSTRAGIGRFENDSTRYLYCALDISAGFVKVVDVNGPVTKLTGSTPISAGVTYTLRMVNVGSSYEVFLNGVSQGTFTDTYYSVQELKPGLYQFDESTARFDNFRLAQAQAPGATTWTLRNYYATGASNVLLTGSVSTPVIDIPVSSLTVDGTAGNKYGWYRLYLTGPDHNDGQWGTAYGDCNFLYIADYSGIPANDAGLSTPPLQNGTDEISRGVMAMGINRYDANISSDPLTTTAISILTPQVTRMKTWWLDTADSVRTRKILCAFPSGTAGKEARVTSVVNALKTWVKAWSPRNEPQDQGAASYITELAPFYAAVKAEDSTATVLAPGTVSFGNYYTTPPTGGRNEGIFFFIDFLQRGGDAYCDAYEFHPYNCYNGDLPMMRFLLGCLTNAIDQYGNASKEMYQTEQGHPHAYNGQYMPHYSARWTALMVFAQEVLTQGRMRLENSFYWYDTNLGFDSFPTQWLTSSGPGPQITAIRTQAGECRNKLFTSELDFGYPGKMLYCGGVWTNGSTGDKAIGVIAGSYGANDIRFAVTGASSFTRVDSWGNQTTINASNGFLTFPVSELGSWLRVPSGTTAALVPGDWAWNTNACQGGTPHTNSANNGITYNNLSKMNDAPATYLPTIAGQLYTQGWEDWYGQGGTSGFGSVNQPFIDIQNTYPELAWVTFTSQPLNRFIVWSSVPWHDLSTIIDFDLQTYDGATWTTRKTWTRTNYASFAFTGVDRCTSEAFWDAQSVFDYISPVSITCQGVRLYVRQVSYGTYPDKTTNDRNNNGQGGFGYWLMIRELQAFNTTQAPAPVTGRPTSGAITLG